MVERVLIIENLELEKLFSLLRGEVRKDRKIVVPRVLKEFGEKEGEGIFWKSDGRRVVESDRVQFSVACRENSKGEKPHYHKHQLEIYFSRFPFQIFLKNVEGKGEFKLYKVKSGGRIFIPPSFCHFIQYEGDIEVLQIVVEDIGREEIEKDKFSCGQCPLREVCEKPF